MVIPGLLRQSGDEFGTDTLMDEIFKVKNCKKSAEYTNFPVSQEVLQGEKLWKLTKIAFAR